MYVCCKGIHIVEESVFFREGSCVAQFVVLPVHVTVQLTKCCVMHTCDKLVT